MEVNIAQIEHVLALFDPGRPTPVLLIGAGASVKSGVPASGELVEWAGRWKYCRTHHKHVDDPRIKRTDWLAWLHSHSWYDKSKRAEDNYFEVVERLLIPKSERKEFFLWCINRDVPASSGYEHLLKLLDDGFVSTVLTTNFDHVLPDLKAARKRPHHLEVIRTPDEATAFSGDPVHPQLVYLHGAVEYYTDQNLKQEVEKLRQPLPRLIAPVIKDHPLIVIGYRGAEPSVMKHLLLDNANFSNNYPHGIFWCSLGGQIHPLVTNLADAIKPNLQIVLIPGFDELMGQIAGHCTVIPKSREIIGIHKVSVQRDRWPYDMSPIPEADLSELDWDRVREQLLIYCQNMNMEIPKEISRSWLLDKLCQLDLALDQNGHCVPTVAGYLLFAVDPTRRVEGAYISIKENGQADRRILGNLWGQKEALDTLLDDVNRPFILKTRMSEVVYPYPKIAIHELCVNALVHRSYRGPGGITPEDAR